jgi:hypothetical protein
MRCLLPLLLPAALVAQVSTPRETNQKFESSPEAQKAPEAPRSSAGPYLNQPLPGAVPEVFARGIVSTDHLEHSAPAFSPDGNEVFWSLWPMPEAPGDRQVILTARRTDGLWSKPATAAFSGTFSDGGPVFSADGKRVYFYSQRPLSGEKPNEEYELWVVEKRGETWSAPTCLNLVGRFPELKFAIQPSVTRNGTLYFMAYAKGPMKDRGIYRSVLIDGQYATPELLPASINTPVFLTWTPFIAPDESYLIFSSSRRAHGKEWGDLWISRRKADGTWTDPVMLPEPVNSNLQERFPMVSPDGKILFFTRQTPGHSQDVYWVDARACGRAM